MSRGAPRLIAIVLALLTGCAVPHAQAQASEPNTWTDEAPAEVPAEPAPAEADGEFQDTDPRAITDFKPELDPYGQWVNDPTYGVVWVPHRQAVGQDFAPYVTSGRWSMTADGDWIWVSDYPFGWVVFHYGRWVWIPNTGWSWIPGRKYSHAWVVWRVPRDDYAYVGWAPAPPSYVWMNGAAVSVWFGVYTPYVFCPSYYAFHPYVHRHIIRDRHHVHRIAGRTHRYVPGGSRWGPPPARARIPAKALPAQRVSANPRAIAAARPSTAARALPASRMARPTERASFAPGRGPTPSRTLSSTAQARPSPSPLRRPADSVVGPSASSPRPLMRGVPSRPLSPGPARTSPGSVAPAPLQRPAAPSADPRPIRSYTPPSAAPRSAPTPLRSTSSTVRSAPVRSYTRSAPRSAPVRSYSAPVYRSPPSRSSAPSMRSAPSRSSAPSMRSAPSRSFSSPRSTGGPRRR
ncbi:MAG TPA: DUF6600 domain-containing protein [Polyangiaceae bacterium]